MTDSKKLKQKRLSIADTSQASIHNLRKKLDNAEQTISDLNAELEVTSQGLLALSMEMEERIDQRTKELRAANQQLEQAIMAEKMAKAEIQNLAKFPQENPNPVLRIAHDGTVLYANPSAAKVFEIWGVREGAPLPEDLRELASHAFLIRRNSAHEIKCGERVYLFTLAPIVQSNYINMYGQDITDKKNAESSLNRELSVKASLLRLSSAMVATTDIAQLADVFLEEAKSLTGSSHGLVAVVDESNRDLVCYTLTRMMGKECTISGSDLRIRFSCANDGTYPFLWGHCLNTKEPFYSNSLGSHPAFSGQLPKGHVPIMAFLAAPSLAENTPLGQIALANPSSAYTDEHLYVIETLANQWSIAIQRYRAQRRLIKEKEQAQQYLDIVGAVMVAIDREQKVTLINQAGCRLLGYDEEEILGRNWCESFIPELDRDRVNSVFRDIMADNLNTAEFYNNRVLTRAGETRLVRWHNTVLRDEAGNIIGTLSSGEDITDFKRAERELQKRERLLDNTGRMARVGGWELDAKTLEVSWTPETYRIHEVDKGHKPSLEEAINFFHPEERGRLRRAIQAALEDGAPYDMEIRFISATGRQLWTRTICEPQIEEGQTVKLLGTFQDITERVEALQAIRESERRFRSITENARDFIFIKDHHRRYTFVNNAMQGLLGLPKESILGKSPEEIFGVEQGLVIKEIDDKVFAGETVDETRSLTVGGQLFYFNTIQAPLFYDGNKVASIMGIVRDVTAFKKSEEALEKREKQLDTLMSNLPGMAYRCPNLPERPMLFVSQGSEALTGYTPSELTQSKDLTYGDLVYPEDRQRVWDEVQRSVQSAEPYIIEYRIQDGKGVIRWVWEHGRSVDQTPEGVAILEGFVYDITKRKLAQQELLASEQRFRSTFEQAAVGMAHVAPDGTFLRVNNKLCEILGYAKQELLNLTFQDITHPDDLDADLEFVRQTLAGKIKTYAMEKRYLKKDGAMIWINLTVSLIRNEEGEPVNFVSVIEDITSRKKAEEVVHRYENIVSSSSDMIALIDIDYKYLAVNDAYAAAFGKTQQELVGLTCLEVFGEQAFLGLIQPNLERCKAGNTLRFQQWRKLPATGRVFMDVSYSPYIGSHGSVEGVVVLARDRTKNRLIEEELEKYRQNLELMVFERTAELEMVNKELESFAYSVSHDLRAPLRAMDGFSQALIEDYKDELDQEGRHFLNRIRLASQRMGILIDDILHLSRITRTDMEIANVDLSSLAKKLWENLRLENPERKVEIIIQPGVEARGDEGLLEIVLQNLLQNAWKFSAKSPQAKIEFGRLAKPAGAPEGGQATETFFVRDNGVGFDPAYESKLFMVFQRLHNSEDFPGTGIGLATVQRIISRHGGRVWAESQEGQGATFYFSLGERDHGSHGQENSIG